MSPLINLTHSEQPSQKGNDITSALSVLGVPRRLGCSEMYFLILLVLINVFQLSELQDFIMILALSLSKEEGSCLSEFSRACREEG